MKQTKKNQIKYVIMAIVLLILMVALQAAISVAEESNVTINETILPDANLTQPDTPAPELNESLTPEPDVNTTQTPDETVQDNVVVIPADQVPEQLADFLTEKEPDVLDFEMVSIEPTKTKKGNVVFNVKIQNTGNLELKNLLPVVVARGFSVFDVTPIKTLKPNETKSAYVSGQLTEDGQILITVKVDDKVFYDMIFVEVPEVKVDLEKIKAQEEAKQNLIANLTVQLDDLTEKYNKLDDAYAAKKGNYDLSDVSLAEIKRQLMNAQASLVSEEPDKAKVSIVLANKEFQAQKYSLDRAPKLGFLSKIKDNMVLISAIAGGIITMITLFEVLKKKKEGLYEKIKEIKINKDTKIIVKKKRKGKKNGKDNHDDEDDDVNDAAKEIASAQKEEDSNKEDKKKDDD